ncbi:contractile injection system tape measure protein [Candidatus Electronema sp. PJ]|uniref:contractile injection system tape measure protein n=1 Tax=Candidatus Electronema sp. PJ TaxID=3401572 RepID=UPI003AA8EFB5
MNERHLIDTQIFEIRFPSQEQAEAEQDNGLTDFIKDRLLHIVDQVFTRLCPAQTSIRIDALELDLGILPHNGWRAEMEQRLERELSKVLREKIAALPKGTDGPERLLTPAQNRLAVLRCFLEHGCLPANVGAESDDELENHLRAALAEDSGQLLALLARLRQPALVVQRLKQQFSADLVSRISQLAVANHPDLARLLAKQSSNAALTDEEQYRELLLRAFYENRLEPLRQQWQELFRQQANVLRRELFRHGRQAAVRRRIAWSFPDSMFADLIRLLEPTENEFIEEIVFRPALPKEVVLQSNEQEDQGRKRLREFTLAYLLTERGSRFNKKEYLASLISRMAAHANLAAATLIHSLLDILATLKNKGKVQQDMLLLLQEINRESGVSHQEQQRSRQEEEKSRSAQLEELLRQAFHQHLPDELRRQWPVFFKDYPELIRQSLFRYGQSSSAVRHRIAQHFPDRMFADLIRLLEPTEQEFIEELVFSSSLPEAGAPHSGAEQGKGQEHLREFTLAYLLTERGSRFNKKAYLASLISSMAAHDNVAAAEMAHSLQTMLAAVSSRSRVQQEMLLMLTEMQADKPVLRPQQPAASLTLMQLLALLKERRVSEELIQAVQSYAGQISDHKRYCQLIMACLDEDRPLDFEELLAQCQEQLPSPAGKDNPAVPKPSSILSLAELLALLKERQVGAEFIQAVQHYARQVGNQERYCQLIIACLDEDRPIDFEELLTQCQEQLPSTLGKDNPAALKPSSSILSLAELLVLLKERQVGAEFIQAVQHYARKVGNQERYCQLIKACLDEDRPIDFEELLALCQQQPTEQAAPKKLPAVSSLAQLLDLLRKMALSKELIEAVECHAQQAGDLKCYCELIAACLNEDQPIDLEEIVAQSQKGSPADKRHSVPSVVPEMSLPISLTQFRLSAAEEELAALLLRPASLSATELAALAHLLEKMLMTSSARLRYLFEAVVGASEDLAARIGQAVNTSTLTRLFALLRPAECSRCQVQADLITLACCAAPFGVTSETVQRLKQLFISRWLFAPGRRLREQNFALAFAEFLHEQLQKQDRLGFLEQLQRQIVKEKQGSKKQARQAVATLLNTAIIRLKSNANSSAVQTAAASRKLEDVQEEDFDEEVHVENAGLVIAALYLPRLFAMLGLLEKSIFCDREAAERAVHLLQYMAEERTDRPEYQLVLNKILCGVQTGLPIVREIEASEEEKQAIDGLLAAVIQHWGALGSTSVAGLREAFLQRSGHLRLKDDAWYLEVEQKAYDMLLDRLPWSFSLIKLPWMQRLVHVKWR